MGPTKLGRTGVKHIKNCIDCSEVLTLGGNWTEARESQSKYLCKTCWTIRDSLRMYVNGIEVSQSHPLYKAGHYKNFESAAFSALEGYEKSNVGHVYVISNPAWEGWYKVGMAVDASDRCSSYQTSSPFRDYMIEYIEYFDDRRKAEKTIHSKLRKNKIEHVNEWFKSDLNIIKNTIKNIKDVQHEA